MQFLHFSPRFLNTCRSNVSIRWKKRETDGENIHVQFTEANLNDSMSHLLIWILPHRPGGTFQRPPVKDSLPLRTFQSPRKTVFHRGRGPAKINDTLFCFCCLVASLAAIHQSPHHLLQYDLHQVFNALVWVLLAGLPDQAVLQHVKHLLPGDVVVTIQIIDMETI